MPILIVVAVLAALAAGLFGLERCNDPSSAQCQRLADKLLVGGGPDAGGERARFVTVCEESDNREEVECMLAAETPAAMSACSGAAR